MEKSIFPQLLGKLCPTLSAANLIAGFRGSGLYPVDRSKVNARILKDRPSALVDDEEDDLPTPHKAMRDAVIKILSPPTTTVKKRGPRKRVQGMNYKDIYL